VDPVRKWRGGSRPRGLGRLADRPARAAAADQRGLTGCGRSRWPSSMPAATGVPLSRGTGREMLAEVTGRAGPQLSVSRCGILAEHRSSPGSTVGGSPRRDPDFAPGASVILDLYQGFAPRQAAARGDASVRGRKAVHPGRGRCRPTPGRAQASPVRPRTNSRHGALALLRALDADTGKVSPPPGNLWQYPYRTCEQVMSMPETRTRPGLLVIVETAQDTRQAARGG